MCNSLNLKLKLKIFRPSSLLSANAGVISQSEGGTVLCCPRVRCDGEVAGRTRFSTPCCVGWPSKISGSSMYSRVQANRLEALEPSGTIFREVRFAGLAADVSAAKGPKSKNVFSFKNRVPDRFEPYFLDFRTGNFKPHLLRWVPGPETAYF